MLLFLENCYFLPGPFLDELVVVFEPLDLIGITVELGRELELLILVLLLLLFLIIILLLRIVRFGLVTLVLLFIVGLGTTTGVIGVCTLKGSSFNADHCDLSKICQKHNISWAYMPNINSEEAIRWLADKNPDVIFCFGWSKLLGKRLLNLAPLGVIGFHPAALPANRGRHPLIWALVLGLRETASTFFFMAEGADTGDILSQRKIEISDEDDAAMLYEKVTTCALEQIKTFVQQLNSGSAPRMVQASRQANTWRK